jgi:predicted lysophospholipase L1 biosynthesis ABC-type transport system permease subunit
MGPFVKLGPLRDSDIALFAGFLSTIGLIIILTLALTIYGVASFGQENQSHQMKMICKLKSLGSIQRWILLVHAECRICIYLFVKYSDTAS